MTIYNDKNIRCKFKIMLQSDQNFNQKAFEILANK